MDFEMVNTPSNFAILVEEFTLLENSGNGWSRHAFIETFDNLSLYRERIRTHERENTFYNNKRVFVTDLGKLSCIRVLKIR